MSNHLIWMLLAGLLLVGEMLSGTFYLLVIALAFCLSALLAWLGSPLALQLLAAAIFSLGGLGWLWRKRRASANQNNAPDNLLDIGQQVTILQWHTPSHARVRHRGTDWDAELSSGRADADAFFIVGIRGSTLLLSDQKPEA